MNKATIYIINNGIEEFSTILGKAMINFQSDFHIEISSYEALSGETDILLISEEIESRKDINLKYKLKITLTHQRKNDEGTIFIFTPVKEMMKEIHYLWRKNIENNSIIINKADAKVIAFQSGLGGTGKTTLSISLGREIAQQFNKKILYINFESINILPVYFKHSDARKRGIEEFIYYLFNHGLERIIDIEGFLHDDDSGLLTFYSNSRMNQLKNLNSSEMNLFLNTISEYGNFDYIFLDCSNDLSNEMLDLIKASDTVFLVKDDRENEHPKDIVVESIIKDELKKNCMTISNKVKGKCKECDIAFEPESFYCRKEFIEINRNGKYGLCVNKLAAFVVSERIE